MKFNNPFSKKKEAPADPNGAAENKKPPKPPKEPKPPKAPKAPRKRKSIEASEYKTESDNIIQSVCSDKGELRTLMNRQLDGYNSVDNPLTKQEAEKMIFAMLDRAAAERTSYMSEFVKICKNGDEALKYNERIMDINALEIRVEAAKSEFNNASKAYNDFKAIFEKEDDAERVKQEAEEKAEKARAEERASLKEQEFKAKQELKSFKAKQKVEKAKRRFEKKQMRDIEKKEKAKFKLERKQMSDRVKKEKAELRLDKQRKKYNLRTEPVRKTPAPQPADNKIRRQEFSPYRSKGFEIDVSDKSSGNMSYGVRDDAEKQ